jgi:predicted DNA-binding transcriptional regulator AlpA
MSTQHKPTTGSHGRRELPVPETFGLEPLLDTETAAAVIGMSPQHLRYLRSTGGDVPPAVKIGRMVRYRPSTLRDWIAAHEEGAK